MRIGLISDTHMPQRWKSLPEGVFKAFADVDLILHAGDVGELWVLDELSKIAPVVAVHGNDETEEATAALPYLQTLSIEGHRIVLTHAHFPDRAEEMASRVNDWKAALERRAAFATKHGASICIFGHTHIPMRMQYGLAWLINPGAIASGNVWTMQQVQTVAILTLEKGEEGQLKHIDVATGELHAPFFDSRGFAETFAPYNKTIYDEAFLPYRDWFWWELGEIAPIARETFLNFSREVWDGKKDIVRLDEVVKALYALNQPRITEKLNQHFLP